MHKKVRFRDKGDYKAELISASLKVNQRMRDEELLQAIKTAFKAFKGAFFCN